MDILKLIAERIPSLEILENEAMSAHTSFHIGGPATAVLMPGSSEELAAVLKLLTEEGRRPFILGNGTNVLAEDGIIDRIVIKTDRLDSIERLNGTDLLLGSGVLLSKAASEAQKLGLAGMEFAHGIPGSVGGAASMNAGAYGSEMKDIVMKTVCCSPEGEIRERFGAEHAFGYRHSVFSDSEDVVISTSVGLWMDDPVKIKERMVDLMVKRRASQPLDMPSAGSTFKRPEGGFAAALIDKAGLKGFSIGGAMVSRKHAGFVVNTGGATCKDVMSLIEHIQKTVLEQSGILLEPEIKFLRSEER